MARGSGEEGRTTSNGQCLIDAHKRKDLFAHELEVGFYIPTFCNALQPTMRRKKIVRSLSADALITN